jgi:hypothetical protein
LESSSSDVVDLIIFLFNAVFKVVRYAFQCSLAFIFWVFFQNFEKSSLSSGLGKLR